MERCILVSCYGAMAECCGWDQAVSATASVPAGESPLNCMPGYPAAGGHSIIPTNKSVHSPSVSGVSFNNQLVIQVWYC